jgi:hypothetical protein
LIDVLRPDRRAPGRIFVRPYDRGMPRKVTVVRCPVCGSTDAGEDRERGAYDLTMMVCASCGHEQYQDHWDIKFNWNVDIELADDATELPKKVPH